MLYYLFTYLDKQFDFVGAGVFQYISFRAGAAAVLSLLITIMFGKKLIDFLRKKQVGESVRDLGLEGQMQKKGTHHGRTYHYCSDIDSDAVACQA